MDKAIFKEKLRHALYQVAGKTIEKADNRELYLSLGLVLKVLIGIKLANDNRSNSKKVYYLSMEYLTGTFTKKNLHYLGLFHIAQDTFNEWNHSLEDILSEEKDPGLGNGGLGRLAAGFMDSMTNLGIPGNGYGIRYESGLFKQKIENGMQEEIPDDWQSIPNIWEYKRAISYEVRFGGNIEISGSGQTLNFNHRDYERVKALAYDIPYIGYKSDNSSYLRLWAAESYIDFDFNLFSSGYLIDAYKDSLKAKTITQVLYPNDSNLDGKKLRLKQEYFLASASIQDIIKNYLESGGIVNNLNQYVTIHINDTHPTLMIPELMRILLDEFKLDWVEAWNITVNTFAYTNHTILPEAMERWDIPLIKEILPRIWLIIEEINHRFVYEIKNELHIDDYGTVRDLSIIEDNVLKMVNLAIVGSYSVNGVAELHTNILKERVLQNFYKIFPDSFINITNGIVHRRWLLNANPRLFNYLERKIGNDFIESPHELIKLLDYKDDSNTLKDLMTIKHENKQRLRDYIFQTQGVLVSPYAIFDVHIKRIHEYKRQLLNALHIIYLYNQLKENPNLDMVPRVFIFSGKAAPGYFAAKEILRLIISLSNTINNDRTIKEKLKVVFIENYDVSKAEIIIPAADVSQQISTTTKEASGTGNMKLMMNGAITLATQDGANVEIAREVGEDNIVLFGLKDYEVYNYIDKDNYNSKEYYYGDKNIKQALDTLIQKDGVGFGDFRFLYDLLTKYNDMYFILKDFEDYRLAQEKISDLYRDGEKWAKMSLTNIAHSGKFSLDNTVRKYAEEIWNL